MYGGRKLKLTFKVATILSCLLLLTVTSAMARDGVVKDPNGTAPERYLYYHGTEELGKEG